MQHQSVSIAEIDQRASRRGGRKAKQYKAVQPFRIVVRSRIPTVNWFYGPNLTSLSFAPWCSLIGVISWRRQVAAYRGVGIRFLKGDFKTCGNSHYV